MMTMYSYFEQMWSGGPSSITQPPPRPLPPPSPSNSPHHRTPGDDDGISDTNDDQYS